ncbi:DsbA family protein [Tropicimonas sp.]|uniref:DsbA family protein n=1 Tax=Tropicimonas sp. TaxID=2067044 RepID=UPI003A84A0F7
MATSRRQLLFLFLTGMAMSAGVSGLLRRRPIGLETAPLPGVPGFRYLIAGSTSGGVADPFFGIGQPESRPAGDLAYLFTAPARPGQVEVASFSDYNCPYCRVLSKTLAGIAGDGEIAVTWHELPLLGPASVAAARAALAADMQGAYLPFHNRMMATRFRPTAPYLTEAAGALGIDGDRLLADMEGPEVAARLRRSAGLANLFGIVGTPALVVGRTLVLGNIRRRDLERLIGMERRG